MTKINLLTWNIDNNRDDSFFDWFNDFLNKKVIDVLILQECLTGPVDRLLNYKELEYPKEGDPLWVRIFIRKDSEINYCNTTPLMYNKLLATELYLSDNIVFTLIGVHFYSKFDRSVGEQNNKNSDISLLVKEIESKHGHNKTLLVGDFNYSPFEQHLNDPKQLNAINSKELIRFLNKRKCGRYEYDFFYNPMWNVIGDYDYRLEKESVSGTYYWEADDAEKYYWNLFDGVLINHSIMDSIDLNDLRIISEGLIEYQNDNNVKNVKFAYSDHLPVEFTIIKNKLKI